MTDTRELPPWPPPESRAFFDTLVGIVRAHDAPDAWREKGRSAFDEVLRKTCYGRTEPDGCWVVPPPFPHLGRLLCEAMDGPACRTFTAPQQWRVFFPLSYALEKHFYLKRRGVVFHARSWALTQLAGRIGNRRMASMFLRIAGGTTDSYDIQSGELHDSARPSYVAKGFAAQSMEEYKSYGLEDLGELLSIELAHLREGGLVTQGDDGGWRLGPGAPPPPSFAGEPWLLDINTADETQLKALPGIGVKLAQTLIADRAGRGPFTSPEDLLRLPTLKPEMVHTLRPHLMF